MRPTVKWSHWMSLGKFDLHCKKCVDDCVLFDILLFSQMWTFFESVVF